jgi:hypothetical protein
MTGGGPSARGGIHVTELPDSVSGISIQTYDVGSISRICSDAARSDFSIIIIPASSPTHLEFALRAPGYEDFAVRPLVGWVSGVQLEDVGRARPMVMDGRSMSVAEDGAVVMHVTLPATQTADVGIVNIFEQGNGDTITFREDGFSVRDVLINGKETNFAEYIAERRLDTRLPLVADYYGAMVNVSFLSVDNIEREVRFYAPVFAGVSYRHAKPVENYVREFTSRMPTRVQERIVFSCNCILNYLYSGMSEQQAAGIAGPMTFGEVAYQLLNQTMVYLTITDLAEGRHSVA